MLSHEKQGFNLGPSNLLQPAAPASCLLDGTTKLIQGDSVMKDMSDKLNGKYKQAVGHATDNKKLEAEGKAQETSGKAQGKLKKAGEKITHKVDDAT